MKKFLFLLLLFGSFSVLAGNPACRVYGSKNNTVATLTRTNVTSDSRAVLGGQVQLTKTESEDITIIVEVWDGNRDIGRTTVTIPAGASYAGFSMTRDNNGIEPNNTYQLAISSATCQ